MGQLANNTHFFEATDNLDKHTMDLLNNKIQKIKYTFEKA